MSNNVQANIITGTNKDGQQYKAVQFTILTSQGAWKSRYCYPSSLEIALIEQALNPMQAIYGDASPKTDGEL